MSGPKRHRTPTELCAMVAANVRSLRLARGMSTIDLSRSVGEQGCAIQPTGITKLELSGRRISVDELAALGSVFRIAPWNLTQELCPTCLGSPPPRFTCNDCGTTGGDR